MHVWASAGVHCAALGQSAIATQGIPATEFPRATEAPTGEQSHASQPIIALVSALIGGLLDSPVGFFY
jgi:hypothetical protein